MSYTIYANKVNDYPFTTVTWSNARSAPKGTSNLNPSSPIHRIVDNGISFTFVRTYMEFDLSSVTDPITSITLHVNGNGVTGNTSYVVYGGQSALSDGPEDYSLYLVNLNGSSELSTIVIPYREYASCTLDINTYPPADPPGYYIIGLIADADFLNNDGGTFSGVLINNTDQLPYLIINGDGYANNVIGVPGASITTVSGVPSANITNIMGV